MTFHSLESTHEHLLIQMNVNVKLKIITKDGSRWRSDSGTGSESVLMHENTKKNIQRHMVCFIATIEIKKIWRQQKHWKLLCLLWILIQKYNVTARHFLFLCYHFNYLGRFCNGNRYFPIYHIGMTFHSLESTRWIFIHSDEKQSRI